jgi:hypothetical protein
MEKNPRKRNQREQVAADFSTLKMEAIRSSETSVQFTRSTRRHIPEDGILHSHRRGNLKSYRQQGDFKILLFFSKLGNHAKRCQYDCWEC